MNSYFKLARPLKAAYLLIALLLVSLLAAASGDSGKVYSDSGPEPMPPAPHGSATGAALNDQPANGQQGEGVGITAPFACEYVWPPAADSILWAGNPNQNYGALDLLWVGENAYRAPIRWTLPPLPTRFMITDVKARLALVDSLAPEAMNVTAHALTQSWTEGGVTWNSRDGVNLWVTPGGTFLAQAEDEVLVTDLVWPDLWDWQLTDLVTEWYNGQRPNHGIILKSEGYPTLWVKRFGSKEHANWKPQLDICYTVGPVILTEYTPVTWGVPSPDWYQFTRGSFWNIIAIRPDSGDYDLTLYSDPNYSTILNGSAYGGNSIDYVVVDGNHAPGGAYYPQVYQFSGRGAYQVQHGASTMDLDYNAALAAQRSRTGTEVAPELPPVTEPAAVLTGSYGPYSFLPEDVARIWDAWLENGLTYYFGVHASEGDAQLGLALHKSTPDASASFYQRRGQALVQAIAPAGGQPAFINYTSGEEDWYGFLVLNNGATEDTTYYIHLDTTAPTGSISIAGGAAYVNTTTVNLSLLAEDAQTGVHSMRFSNSGDPDGAWLDFSANHTWELSSGEGVKTTYAQFRNFAGMGSAVYFDTVILDQTPPTASASCEAEVDVNSFTVNWSGNDALSGVASYDVQYRVGDGAWTSWLSAVSATSGTFGPTSPLPVQYDQTYSFRVRARDNAGNVGAFSSLCATHVNEPVIYLPAIMNQVYACFPGPSEIEPNDTFAQANGPLCSGVSYTGSPDDHGSATDNDYFYIEMATSGTIHIQVTNFLTNKAQVILYDQSQTYLTHLADQPSGQYTLTHSGGPGRYYIRVVAVEGHEVGHGPYTLVATFP
jgi:hypothetical protein